MIRIILGNVGSGKTALAVREMHKNKFLRKTFTNIKTPLDNVVPITAEMIVKKEVIGHKKTRSTGEIEPVIKRSLNLEYWQNIKEPINVTLDEAHAIINSRRSLSKVNIIMTDWLSLIRRVLGETKEGNGNLTFITQLPKRLDSIARDMATNITYCIMHYLKKCGSCGRTWQENSEMPETISQCVRCFSNKLVKYGHAVEVWEFAGMDKFEMWNLSKHPTYYKHYFVKDIQNYFSLYDTLQWDNLFTDFYY